MYGKWVEVNGIKCQGMTEARACKILQSITTTKRGKVITTPFGRYTPDFDCGDFFVEVKGPHTWMVALGLASILENARNPALAKKSDTSLKKMCWVNDNIKPVVVFVDQTQARKGQNDYEEPNHGLDVFKGLPQTFGEYVYAKNNLSGVMCS